MKLVIPYHLSGMHADIPDSRLKAVLAPHGHEDVAGNRTEEEIVLDSLFSPIDSPGLAGLAAGKSRILIITSDHTRPMPSRVTMPLLLREARRLNPAAHIKILVATGFHRATTEAELRERFGDVIVDSEDISVHDASDDGGMVHKGVLPSGGALKVNRLVDWAELVIAEGFIEPHFFAGFSGGRKSILPGICSRDTVFYNHNAEFIAHPKSQSGVLEGNPIHRDMEYAAGAAGLSFILNVTLGHSKKITAAFAGNPVSAHLKGCEAVSARASVSAVKADIVVTSNGGYPLDQNIYQSVKSMTAAEACVNPGGVIVVASSCSDGHGGEDFYRYFAELGSPEEVARRIGLLPRGMTAPDQWQAQILARVLRKCRAVIIVSEHVEPRLVENMQMKHAKNISLAIEMADAILGSSPDIVVIPDGVGVIVK